MKKQHIKSNDKNLYELLKEYNSAEVVSIKKKLKSTIVSKMIPIVKHIAKTIARRSYDPIDDLVQAGFIGVLKAIDNFCETKNDNFKVYAGYLIIGEMKHYIRDKLDTIRVPRHIQELTLRINSFVNTLTVEEVYNLTSEYVADALQIPVQDVDFAMQVDRRRSTISLDDLYAGSDHSLSYEEMFCSSSYSETSRMQDAKIRLDEIIDELPPEERVLIDLYYNQDLSKKEIAEQMDLTEKQVARILSNAFEIMHNNYAENGEIW